MTDQSSENREQHMARVSAALQVLTGEELLKLVEYLEDGVARYERANLVMPQREQRALTQCQRFQAEMTNSSLC